MKRAVLFVLVPSFVALSQNPAAPARAGPDEAPAAAVTSRDLARHVEVLKKKLPDGGGFSIVVERPFVVVGDEPEARVRSRAEGTVRWAVEKLKREYFEKDPAEVIDVWLFKDKESYERHTKAVFGEDPISPYGYYSPGHRALIMNIATGGGTLVHEIVHPFVRANFPSCPTWFNEGLGSLYEQCEEKAGRIHGLTNWRLAGLKRAIGEGSLPSFEKLTAMDSTDFYEKDRGTCYAQARYLCYYLQEKDLLARFYRDFVANQKTDPTGHGTLKKVLGEADMDAFKKRWEKFVLGLSFP